MDKCAVMTAVTAPYGQMCGYDPFNDCAARTNKLMDTENKLSQN